MKTTIIQYRDDLTGKITGAKPIKTASAAMVLYRLKLRHGHYREYSHAVRAGYNIAVFELEKILKELKDARPDR